MLGLRGKFPVPRGEISPELGRKIRENPSTAGAAGAEGWSPGSPEHLGLVSHKLPRLLGTAVTLQGHSSASPVVGLKGFLLPEHKLVLFHSGGMESTWYKDVFEVF